MSKIELSEYLAKNGNVTVDEDDLNKLLGVEPKRGGMPKCGEVYRFITSCGQVDSTYWAGDSTDIYRYYTLNCFKTEEKAEKAKDAMLMCGKLMIYAKEHNEGELNWEDGSQNKYGLYSDPSGLHYYTNQLCRGYNELFFTSSKIRSDAIESVGGEDEVLRVLYGVE